MITFPGMFLQVLSFLNPHPSVIIIDLDSKRDRQHCVAHLKFLFHRQLDIQKQFQLLIIMASVEYGNDWENGICSCFNDCSICKCYIIGLSFLNDWIQKLLVYLYNRFNVFLLPLHSSLPQCKCNPRRRKWLFVSLWAMYSTLCLWI